MSLPLSLLVHLALGIVSWLTRGQFQWAAVASFAVLRWEVRVIYGERVRWPRSGAV